MTIKLIIYLEDCPMESMSFESESVDGESWEDAHTRRAAEMADHAAMLICMYSRQIAKIGSYRIEAAIRSRGEEIKKRLPLAGAGYQHKSRV